MKETGDEPPEWMAKWEKPSGFEAYCYIFHPVWLSTDPSKRTGPDADREAVADMLPDLPSSAMVTRQGPKGASGDEFPAKWSSLLTAANGAFEAEVSVWELRKRNQIPESLPWPNEGILDEPYLSRVIDILARHSPVTTCHAYYTCPPTLFMCPDRPHWLVDLSEVSRLTADEMDGCSPTYLWADDMSWCLNTNTDNFHTMIGAEHHVIQALLDDEVLDTHRVEPASAK